MNTLASASKHSARPYGRPLPEAPGGDASRTGTAQKRTDKAGFL